MRELGLFREWFLQRHLGVALDADEDAALAGIELLLVDAALAQPQVLVHRDFMLRNLMPVAAGPAVLDFQDAVREPIAYDVRSEETRVGQDSVTTCSSVGAPAN